MLSKPQMSLKKDTKSLYKVLDANFSNQRIQFLIDKTNMENRMVKANMGNCLNITKRLFYFCIDVFH